MVTYFVSYHLMTSDGLPGFGNTVVVVPRRIRNEAALRDVERAIRGRHGYHPVVLNLQVIDEGP